jgi:hypothetical protein
VVSLPPLRQSAGKPRQSGTDCPSYTLVVVWQHTIQVFFGVLQERPKQQ